MVNATIIFIIAIIVIAILAIIISYIYLQRQREARNGPDTPDRSHPTGWSQEVDGPDPSRNFCGVYTFPATDPSQPEILPSQPL